MRCEGGAAPGFSRSPRPDIRAGSDRRSDIVRLMTAITISTGAAARFKDDTHAQPSDVVRRSQVGELGEQIAVRSYLILRHLPICEDSKEGIDGVVGERPAIAGVGRRARGV